MIAALADILFQGITLGGLYGMIGAGLALSYGILKVVQLAHGEYITIGAFMAVAAVGIAPWLPLWAALALAFVGCAGLGLALQMAAVERAMSLRDPIVPMMVTFGLSVILRNGLVETVGADLRGLDIGGLAQANISLGGMTLGLLPLVSLIIALAAFAGLTALIFYTKLGREIRAVSDRPDIAALMGIRVTYVHGVVAALSAGLAAIAGVLLAMRASVSPFSGVGHLLIAFEVVVLGGLGGIRAVLAAGMLLGMTQVISARFDPNAGLLYVHLVFFSALIWRAMRGRLL